MSCRYIRKSAKGLLFHDHRLEAINLLLVEYLSQVSKENEISKIVLARYVQNYKKNPNCRLTPNYTHSQVFTYKKSDKLFKNCF